MKAKNTSSKSSLAMVLLLHHSPSPLIECYQGSSPSHPSHDQLLVLFADASCYRLSPHCPQIHQIDPHPPCLHRTKTVYLWVWVSESTVHWAVLFFVMNFRLKGCWVMPRMVGNSQTSNCSDCTPEDKIACPGFRDIFMCKKGSSSGRLRNYIQGDSTSHWLVLIDWRLEKGLSLSTTTWGSVYFFYQK